MRFSITIPYFRSLSIALAASISLTCISDITHAESSTPLTLECFNKIDDDSDGLIDEHDIGCIESFFLEERGPSSLPCDNGQDDDNDGLIDYPWDPDCSSPFDLTESYKELPDCKDELDNDGDGLIDSEDPGCNSSDDSMETNINGPACDDGIDNDNDGLIDYPADLSCESVEGLSETNPNDPACRNGIDDDGDGSIDYEEDFGCSSPDDTDEHEQIFECDDGLDNDQDGTIDYPSDPDCVSSTDQQEATGTECSNEIDDDGDGLVDENDPGCHMGTSGTSEIDPIEICFDGLDNDGNGDYDDELECLPVRNVPASCAFMDLSSAISAIRQAQPIEVWTNALLSVTASKKNAAKLEQKVVSQTARFESRLSKNLSEIPLQVVSCDAGITCANKISNKTKVRRILSASNKIFNQASKAIHASNLPSKKKLNLLKNIGKRQQKAKEMIALLPLTDFDCN